MDSWGDSGVPCPCCGGKVKWWDFEIDCRGNSGSAGACCENCHEKWTLGAWMNIEKECEKHRRRIK